MSHSPNLLSESDPLQSEAQRLRTLGVLGKSGPLMRLFDYLLARSAGPAPKEIEIAIEVFGKRSDFDVAQDSVVRVYMHKLRKRLDEHYARQPGAGRLVVPKGEYRLTYEAAPSHEPVHAAVEPPTQGRELWMRVCIAGVALLIGAAAAWALSTRLGASAAERELSAVRTSGIWAPILHDDAPIAIIIGDYYLLGENDAAGNVARLVREFHINSKADLLDHLELDPQRMARYRDLDLTYLPASIAWALHSISPLLSSKARTRVLLMSQLEGDTLANSHVVYIGYLSGLGMLGDTVLEASRLELGGTYDELVDRSTRQTYMARQPAISGEGLVDYGYLAAMDGPNGHRWLIVAGTRDLGVIETARSISNAASAAILEQQSAGTASFEALTRVTGMAGARIDTDRVFVAPIN